MHKVGAGVCAGPPCCPAWWSLLRPSLTLHWLPADTWCPLRWLPSSMPLQHWGRPWGPWLEPGCCPRTSTWAANSLPPFWRSMLSLPISLTQTRKRIKRPKNLKRFRLSRWQHKCTCVQCSPTLKAMSKRAKCWMFFICTVARCIRIGCSALLQDRYTNLAGLNRDVRACVQSFPWEPFEG